MPREPLRSEYPPGVIRVTEPVLEDPFNADWTKQHWDVDLPQTVEALRSWLDAAGMSVEHFKGLPLYRLNVDRLPWLQAL